MKIVRVFQDGDARYGLADESTITLITDEPFAQWETEGVVPLDQAHLMPPVTATKIVCVGLNYHAHAEELGMAVPDEPVLFLKPPTAINAGQRTARPVPCGPLPARHRDRRRGDPGRP